MTMNTLDLTGSEMERRKLTFTRKEHKRSVRFAPEPDLEVAFPSTYCFMEDDVEDLWYTKDEYQLIKKAYCFIVQMMDRKQLIDDHDDEMCTRGLESRTRIGARRRRQMIEDSLDSVLCEQERQWDEGYFSAVAIAEAYQEVSAISSMTAYITAQRDAKEALGDRQALSKTQPKTNSSRVSKCTEKLHRQSSQSSVRSQ